MAPSALSMVCDQEQSIISIDCMLEMIEGRSSEREIANLKGAGYNIKVFTAFKQIQKKRNIDPDDIFHGKKRMDGYKKSFDQFLSFLHLY